MTDAFTATTALTPYVPQSSDAAINLIVTEEDGNQAYYTRHYTHFEWPEGASDARMSFAGRTVVVTGAEDTAPGLKASRAQSEAAPQGSLLVVGGCGHYVPLERPAALNSILRKVIAAQNDP